MIGLEKNIEIQDKDNSSEINVSVKNMSNESEDKKNVLNEQKLENNETEVKLFSNGFEAAFKVENDDLLEPDQNTIETTKTPVNHIECSENIKFKNNSVSNRENVLKTDFKQEKHTINVENKTEVYGKTNFKN